LRIISKVRPLAAAIASAAKIVKEGTGMPTLGCVLLDAADSNVLVEGTDVDTRISHRVPAAVASPGRICIPGNILADYMAALPDGELEIQATGLSSVEIRRGSSRAQIYGLPADPFPTLPAGMTRSLRNISGESFANAASATSFAVSKSEAQPAPLHGTHVSFGEIGFCLTASDGYRLARYTRGRQDARPRAFVVPLAGLLAIARAFKESPNLDISTKIISDEEHHFIATDGRSIVSTRLLCGQYPDTSALLGIKPTMVATIDRENFVTAIRRAELMTDDRSRTLAIQIKNNECEIDVRSETYGAGHELLPVLQEGSSVNVEVNAVQLAQILSHIESTQVTLGFSGALGPISISETTIAGSPPADAQYLLMPLTPGLRAA
jgi:DNA polymerase-3 subunit beta